MTELELRRDCVDIMKSWLGAKKGSDTHHGVIDIYNSYKPLPRNVRMSYTMDWCAATVSAVGIAAKLTDIMPVECSCGELIKLYKNLGCWVENDAHIPRIGDLILYAWNDDGKGDCTLDPNHVGMVTDVTGSVITVVEGNMGSDSKVGERKININGRYIRGYCCPDYAKKAKELTEKEANEVTKNEVQKMIDDSLNKLKKEFAPTIYKTLNDVPVWALPTVKTLVESGKLLGDGNGNLNLTEDLTRALVIMNR